MDTPTADASSSTPSAKPQPRPYLTTAALILILALALALRLHGINWDSGAQVHPDERAISGWVSNLQFPHGLGDLFDRNSHWNPTTRPDGTHDPAGFNYGSLPMYLAFLFGHLMDWLAGIFPWWSSWKGAYAYGGNMLAGRVLSAFADTVTVFLVCLIATRLAGKLTGLYAAALAAFAVLSIQLAHFSTVDAMLATLATGTVLACMDLFTHGRPRDYILAGIWLAAAVATKASAVPLVAVVLGAHLWYRWRAGDLLGWRTYVYPLISLYAFLAALFVFQPYTFSDWSDFWTAVQTQRDLADGTTVVFYTRKWAGTTPIIYPFQQLTLYSLGLPLALLAYAGVVYEAIRVWTPRRNAGALVLLFVLVYFASAGILYMKYLRYMMPIVPSLCILAALFVSALVRNRLWLVGRLVRPIGMALGGVVLLLTACYGLAYEHIYAQPITHIQATCWLYAHVPSGTPLAQDSYDETLPIGLPAGTCRSPQANYPQAGGQDMPHYDGPDSAASLATMSAILSQAQYYLIPGRRAMDTMAAQPDQFSYYHHFYQVLLASGVGKQDALGYTLVAYFSEHPTLGPWTFDDYGANQNFNEYDHPPVWIFKNTGHLGPIAIGAAITGGGRVPPPAQNATPPKSLLLTAKDLKANAHGPTYDAMFPPGGLPMRLPIPAWLLMVELLGLLALPISMRLFGRLADRGFVLAKTVSFLLLSWFAWILPSLHIMEYSRAEIALCLLPIIALSLLWGVRPREVLPLLRARRNQIMVTEGVFLLAFAAFVWIRMLYPDLWHLYSGGEKTMDFSFLNAIVRSRVMPPLDPFYGGGHLNYYYYGQFTVATLLKLIGIAPATGINLVIPTYFALALAGCVSLGLSIARHVRYALLAGAFALLTGNLVGGQVLVGDLQAVAPGYFKDRLHPVVSAGVDFPILGGLVDAVSFAWSALTGFIQGAVAVVAGIWQVLFNHAAMPQYFFVGGWPWDQSRILDDHHVITEFPFWTFLFADPHAHMWDVPLVICIMGLAINLIARAQPEAEADGPSVDGSRSFARGASLVIWPVMGLMIGAVGPTNPWDLATVLGAMAVALLTNLLLSGRTFLRSLLFAACLEVVLAVFALGLYLPFYSHFQSFYSHIGWTIFRHQSSLGDFFTHWGFLLFVLVSYLVFAVLHDTNVGLWLRIRARAALFVLYYWDRRRELPRYFDVVRAMRAGEALPSATVEYAPGVVVALLACTALILLLFVTGSWLLGALLGLVAVGLVVTLDQEGELNRVRRVEYLPSVPVSLILGLGDVLLLVLLAVNYWVLSILLVLLSCTLLLLVDQRRRPAPAVYGLHLLILVGIGLAAAGEVVYVKDFYDADPVSFRNNTVFKIYEEAWVMMGVGAGVGLARLLGPLLGGAPRALAGALAPAGMGLVATGSLRGMARERPAEAVRRRSGLGGWAWTWLAALVLLFAGVIISPIRITPLRVQERQTWPALATANIRPTLDGMAFLKYLYPGDYAAIQWINANITGSPIILQSHHGGYRNFAARVTMFTGLPSLVNWGGEASQQRYDQQQANATQTYPNEFVQREADADTIYTTTDPSLALQLLHQYHVSYVYVGQIEREGFPNDAGGWPQPYPPSGLLKFELMTTAGQLDRVYTNRWGVTIYRVR